MLDKAKNIYIAGIGGIGVSALAQILKAQGKTVSGADIEPSEITDFLQKNGIKVQTGQRVAPALAAIDLLIYSAAVPENAPVRQRARQTKIPEMSYPEALGEHSKSYEKVIGIAGTNGKTTTTAMVAKILETAYEDPTAVVGSRVLAWGSNARVGGKKFLVLEADEYRRAFLHYPVDVGVITNIEADHLDYYRDLADIQKAFGEYSRAIKPGGVLVYNADDENSKKLAEGFGGHKVSFGFGEKAAVSPRSLANLNLLIPGRFTLANALAAAGAASALQIPWEKIRQGLENFTGTWRRYEKIGRVGQTEIISDYAHHPTGLKVLLDTAIDEYQGKRILAVFQPHQRNRTKKLFGGFVKNLCESLVTDFIISEIFDVLGREKAEDKISSKELVQELVKCGKNARYAKDLNECERLVRDLLTYYDVALLIGAGDIYKVANKLIGK